MKRRPWTTAPIWRGYPAVIVGGGASFSAKDARLIGMARAADRVRVIAVNDAVYPCWFADIAYAADWTWWNHHGPLPGFAGLKLSIEQQAGKLGPVPEFVDFLRNTGIDGFDAAPDALRTGGEGGYQALHLAAHLGAAGAVLVGFDLVGAHWFGDHPTRIRKLPMPQRDRLERYKLLATHFEKRRFPVVTTTNGSPLGMFKFVPLEKAIGGGLTDEKRAAAKYPKTHGR